MKNIIEELEGLLIYDLSEQERNGILNAIEIIKNYIELTNTIENNWKNQLITNEIQYNNCKKLLAEERNNAIDEFAEMLKDKYSEHKVDNYLRVDDYYSYSDSCKALENYIDEIKQKMKEGSKE